MNQADGFDNLKLKKKNVSEALFITNCYKYLFENTWQHYLLIINVLLFPSLKIVFGYGNNM